MRSAACAIGNAVASISAFRRTPPWTGGEASASSAESGSEHVMPNPASIRFSSSVRGRPPAQPASGLRRMSATSRRATRASPCVVASDKAAFSVSTSARSAALSSSDSLEAGSSTEIMALPVLPVCLSYETTASSKLWELRSGHTDRTSKPDFGTDSFCGAPVKEAFVDCAGVVEPVGIRSSSQSTASARQHVVFRKSIHHNTVEATRFVRRRGRCIKVLRAAEADGWAQSHRLGMIAFISGYSDLELVSHYGACPTCPLLRPIWK